MKHSEEKIGFWSVFGLVTGSQIGSGILTLPAQLAPYGFLAFGGWACATLCALALALVFAQLCAWLPKTGGPHVYIEAAFGRSAAFFVGWTYWVISWVSTTVVVAASAGYLLPLMGNVSKGGTLFLEIILLVLITMLNLKGVGFAGRLEFVLAILKFIPLLVIPAWILFYFVPTNIVMEPSIAALPLMEVLGKVTLLSLWGFIGLESATVAAGSVENPRTTIPRAVIAGTACVALLYLLNSLAIMGVVPSAQLAVSIAPYTDAAHTVFGGSWHLLLSLIAAIICLGTLNAWILTSGQIALGLAQDHLMPDWFTLKNQSGAPVVGLITSSAAIVPLLIMTISENIGCQILMVLDISVIAFLFVYFACCLAFVKLIIEKRAQEFSLFNGAVAVVALLFCSSIMYQTDAYTLAIASSFTISGIPLYWWLQKKQKSRI